MSMMSVNPRVETVSFMNPLWVRDGAGLGSGLVVGFAASAHDDHSQQENSDNTAGDLKHDWIHDSSLGGTEFYVPSIMG